MPRRVAVFLAHPDPSPDRLCRVLATAYADSAAEAGHTVRFFDLAGIDIPYMRSKAEYDSGTVPAQLVEAAESIRWAEHVVFVFPLWLGTMPALLKSFLEQALRPGAAFAPAPPGHFAGTMLSGRSARLIVTMGAPALAYRLLYLSHGVAGMRRNILNFVGIKPVRETLFGMVDAADDAKRASWLTNVRRLGAGAK